MRHETLEEIRSHMIRQQSVLDITQEVLTVAKKNNDKTTQEAAKARISEIKKAAIELDKILKMEGHE